MKLKSNKPFYFGAASSSFQVEGGANSDNRSDSIWDEFTKRNYFIPEENTTQREINLIHQSADFFHRFKEDIALMKKQGLNMYRFSISWSRIFPKNEFEVNEKGIEFYHQVIDELLKNDIEPLLTLFHWDLPVWIQCRNGFLNREIIDLFAKYAEVIFSQYGSKVKYFLTFNEMIIFNKNQFIWGSLTPEYKNRSDLHIQAMHYGHVGVAKSVQIFKKLRESGIVKKDAIIGITHTDGPLYYDYNNDLQALEHENLIGNLAYFDPSFKGEYPQELLNLWDKWNLNIDYTDQDLKLIKENVHEFIGWNYYQPIYVQKSDKFNKSSELFSWVETKIPLNAKTTKWNWIIDPQAMIKGLVELTKRYPNLPIIITENGYGDFDKEENGQIHDFERIEYIKTHIEGCYQAIDEHNINLIGYNYWSFQDIFSPSAGYRKRYGFVKVDFETLERTPKLSYIYYKNMISDKNHETDYNSEQLISELTKELKC